jgi:hypothetical protein
VYCRSRLRGLLVLHYWGTAALSRSANLSKLLARMCRSISQHLK